MAISADDVIVGGEYITEKKQLRKVTKITTDNEGRIRVNYECKSANFPDRAWEFCHTIENPPLLSTFVEDCDRKIN